jgi:hypothetical protein
MSMKKKLKVALVMGGGVSLGAFNGGAMAEITRQLHGNLNPELYDGAEIDVLSGASAGGLTLALLLRVLANPESLAGEEVAEKVESTQWDAWVDMIDLPSLIPDPGMERASLLDMGAVDDLASTFLSWPQGQDPRPELLADRVCLAITLLNFNGIPISTSNIKALKDPLSTTLYMDYRYFWLEFEDEGSEQKPDSRWLRYGQDQLSDPETWYEIAATAVAGGAFPLAFEPVAIERGREEYGELWPEEFGNRDAFRFSFGDGGTFDNEPLREAARMAAFLDEGEDPSSFDRVLIYVDPILSGTSHDFSLSFNLPLEIEERFGLNGGSEVERAEPGGRLLGVAARLATVVRGQATFKDFLAADKVNNRLHWRERLRTQLEEVISEISEEAAESLAVKARQRLGGVLEEKKEISVAPRPGLNVGAELQRVGTGGGPEGESARDDLSRALLALTDQVSGLRGKQEVQLIAIGPTEYEPPGGGDPVPVELAGNFGNNFGGFLLHRFREYDFQAGAAMAGSVLASVKIKAPDGTEHHLLVDRNARPSYTVWEGSDPDFDDVPDQEKERLVSRAGEIAQQVTHHLLRGKRWRDVTSYAAEQFARRMVPAAFSDRGLTQEYAPLELVVISPNPGQDEFYLAGQRGGAPTEHVRANRAAQAVIRTLVRYTNSGENVSGPHVLERDREGYLELREHVPLRPDHSMYVGVPPPDQLVAGQAMALPVHRIEVDWSSQTRGEWRLEESLALLVQKLSKNT